jgi:hypothetical protein
MRWSSFSKSGKLHSAITRESDYCTAMAKAGLPIQKKWIVECDHTLKGGVVGYGKLQALAARPTAVGKKIQREFLVSTSLVVRGSTGRRRSGWELAFLLAGRSFRVGDNTSTKLSRRCVRCHAHIGPPSLPYNTQGASKYIVDVRSSRRFHESQKLLATGHIGCSR